MLYWMCLNSAVFLKFFERLNFMNCRNVENWLDESNFFSYCYLSKNVDSQSIPIYLLPKAFGEWLQTEVALELESVSWFFLLLSASLGNTPATQNISFLKWSESLLLIPKTVQDRQFHKANNSLDSEFSGCYAVAQSLIMNRFKIGQS